MERRRKTAEAIRGLYPIVDLRPDEDDRRALALLRAVAVPGVRIVQLRGKDLRDGVFYRAASAFAAAARGLGLLLVVNDRADIAAAVAADGLHLGSDDLPLTAARRILPPGTIVGRSTDTAEEAREAAEAGADYVAWGAAYRSETKTDAAPQEGPAALERVRAAVRGVPLVAIGGITLARVPEIRAAGADAFAVIGALRDAPDAALLARRMVEAWTRR